MRLPNTRTVLLAGILLAVALLGGCTLSTPFYVRNNYPFAISVTRDIHMYLGGTTWDKQLTRETYGVVLPGRQVKMESVLRHDNGTERMDVRDPQGHVVRRVTISGDQLQSAYAAGALFLTVGPQGVHITGGENPDPVSRAGKIIVKTIALLVVFFPVGLILFVWLTPHYKRWKAGRAR